MAPRQRRQQPRFPTSHRTGVDAFVFHSEEMKNAVNNQHLQFPLGRMAEFTRLSFENRQANDEFTQMSVPLEWRGRFKTQDIGRRIFAPITTIETGHRWRTARDVNGRGPLFVADTFRTDLPHHSDSRNRPPPAQTWNRLC